MGSLIHLAILTMGQPHMPALSPFTTSGQRQRHSLYYHTTIICPSRSTLPSLVTSHAPDPPLHTSKRLICCCCCRRLSVSAGCMLLVKSTRSFGINATGLFIFDYVGFMCVVNGARRWVNSGSIIYFQVGY